MKTQVQGDPTAGEALEIAWIKAPYKLVEDFLKSSVKDLICASFKRENSPAKSVKYSVKHAIEAFMEQRNNDDATQAEEEKRILAWLRKQGVSV